MIRPNYHCILTGFGGVDRRAVVALVVVIVAVVAADVASEYVLLMLFARRCLIAALFASIAFCPVGRILFCLLLLPLT